MKIGMAVSWRLIGKCLQELERLGRFTVGVYIAVFFQPYGGFLKWWYPTTIGFPTKNDHFGVFWGYHHFRKHPYIVYLFHFYLLDIRLQCYSMMYGIAIVIWSCC